MERIRCWREICPDLTLRSTFIVGFPGETEQDVARLLAFLTEAELARVGCFTYSPVAGAAANQWPDPVPKEVKQERLARLMELQAAISAKHRRRKTGRTLSVLVDAIDEEGTVIARSTADAPEIDGVVYIENGVRLAVGEFAEAQIVDADEHDLYAKMAMREGAKSQVRRKKTST